MQEIIINVNETGDKTVGILENGKLVEKYEEYKDNKSLEGNIYIGKVKNVLIGMQAAFVDIGENQNTFMHIRDIIPKVSNTTGNKNEQLSKHDIKDYIKSNMNILVQVKKDGTHKKGARVTTHLSLSGRFIVLMPNSDFITISQKIEDEKEIERLKNIVKECKPEGYGAIIRTSAQGKQKEKIQEDMKNIISEIQSLNKQFEKVKDNDNLKPKLIRSNGGIVNKVLTDLIDQDIEKIWTNSKEEYENINTFIQKTENEKNVKVELQEKDLLSKYDLETQLEKTKKRKIWLKCGGFITIDKTEALTAIDVNSGKYTGSKTLEQTVYNVNKEATIEIAKQLRLRDIGGIIIIDYIDMEKQENKDSITELLKQKLKKDRSKTQVIGFTPLDLLEMTRKGITPNSQKEKISINIKNKKS